MAAYGWSNAQAAWAFSLTIFCLGLAAAWGGMNLDRMGPRKLAWTGGALFGFGHLLAALAFWLAGGAAGAQAEPAPALAPLLILYLGYGVIGGCGLGLGYVTPVATVARWFPDKKGLVTGMVVMGFGLGALLMSKVLAPVLLAITDGDLVKLFLMLGAVFILACSGCAQFLRNPSETDLPQIRKSDRSDGIEQAALSHILSGRFVVLWLVFFANITAGISLIGFQSPLLQDLYSKVNPALDPASLAGYGATLIAISSLFNGIGRFFWGGISDRIGRVQVFRIMLLTQFAAFLLLMRVESPIVFGLLVCYILLCYGGGFGTMPSLILDAFGPRLMPVLYGTILTAWSAAGIVGPQIVATIKDRSGDQAPFYAFAAGAAFVLGGGILALIRFR